MQNQLPPIIEAESAMSFGAKVLNIFAAPMEAFQAIKSGPVCTPNWLVPMLIACVVAVFQVIVIFSQPAIMQKIEDKQAEQIQTMVQKGKLTQEQAQQAEKQMQSFMGPTFLKISGSLGAVVTVFAYTFLTGLGVWLIGTKAMPGNFGFMKAVEITAWTQFVGILSGIVTTLLIVAKGNMMVNLGPVLLLDVIDEKSKIHQALISLNVMNLWYLVVLGLGLGCLANVKVWRGIAWVLGIWLALRVAVIGLGIGQSGI